MLLRNPAAWLGLAGTRDFFFVVVIVQSQK